jgi:site-specific recombinase XerD
MYEKFLDTLVLELELRGRSSKTILIYKTEVLKFLNFYSKSIDQVSISDIKQYQLNLIKEGFSPKTINMRMAAIRFFCLNVLEKNWIQMFSPRVKETTTPPSILTPGEVAAVMSEANNFKERLILMMLYSTGIRSFELTEFCIEDINRAEGLLKIKGKNKKIRYVPLPNELLKEFENYWRAHIKPRRSGLFFCKNNECPEVMNTTEVYKIFVSAMRKTGINKKGGAHLLRHSFATRMLELGVSLREIQIILGHSQLRTTEIYTHLRTVRIQTLPNPLSSIISQLKLVG